MENLTIKQQIDQLNDSIYNAILNGEFELLKADDDYICHGWLYSIQLHDSGNLKLDICVNHKDKLVYIDKGPSILDLPNGTYNKLKTPLERSTFKNKIKELEDKRKILELQMEELNEQIKSIWQTKLK